MLDKIRFYILKKLIKKNEMVMLNVDIYTDGESGIPTVYVPSGWTLVHDGSISACNRPHAYVIAKGFDPIREATNILAAWVRTNATARKK